MNIAPKLVQPFQLDYSPLALPLIVIALVAFVVGLAVLGNLVGRLIREARP